MDLKQIKQLIDLMKRSELSEFEVEEEGFKLKIKRDSAGAPVAVLPSGSRHPFAPAVEPAPVAVATAAPFPTNSAPPQAPKEETDITFIKSPMVGTFYLAASPESKPFANVGTKVVETSPVCIIEAMKIMNEIQAETKGTIVEILVENGQPVEYGQRLFKVKQG